MLKSALSLGMAVLALLAAGPSDAQIVPEHVRVGCIVAEKYPKITSCFNPASSLARANSCNSRTHLSDCACAETGQLEKIFKP